MAILVTLYGKTQLLSEEDVELLCNHLPDGDVLRTDLEKALAALPPPGGGNGPGVGPVLYSSDYENVIDAIRSARSSGVSISTDLAELRNYLETAQDPPTAGPHGEATQVLPSGGDGYQVEPPTVRD